MTTPAEVNNVVRHQRVWNLEKILGSQSVWRCVLTQYKVWH